MGPEQGSTPALPTGHFHETQARTNGWGMTAGGYAINLKAALNTI